MSYRDDADALYARTLALQADVERLQTELEDARRGRPRRTTGAPDGERGPLATARPRNPEAWLGALVAKLPAADQDLITELVGLLTARREYPELDGVSEAALDPLIVRLRAAFRTS